MVPTRHDLSPIRVRANLGWELTLGVVTIAEFSVVGITPAKECMVR
jgi:hypothetical protein